MQQVAKHIGDKIINKPFRPMSISVQGNPAIEAGDVAVVSPKTTSSYTTVITDTTFSLFSAQSISSTAETPTAKTFTRYGAATKLLEAARNYTDQEMSAYDLVVQQMSQLAANTLGFHETKIIQDDGSVIVYRHDKPKLSESKIVYKSGIDGFFVTKNYTGKDSTTVWKAGFDSNGNAALNILSVIGIHWDWAYGGTLSLGGVGNENGILKVFDKNNRLAGMIEERGLLLGWDLNDTSLKFVNPNVDGYRLSYWDTDSEIPILSYKEVGMWWDETDEKYRVNIMADREIAFVLNDGVDSKKYPRSPLWCDYYQTRINNKLVCDKGDLTLDALTSKATTLLNVKQNTNAYDLLLMTNGTVTRAASSSRRYKDIGKAITSSEIEEWYKIEPVWAKYKDGYLANGDENEGRYLPMFIAEDVEEHFPQAATHVNNQIEDWNYRMMIPAMFAMIKQQKEEIESLKQAVEEMRGN